MAGSVTIRFPNELIDRIIDHVKWNEPCRPPRDILLTYVNKLQVYQRKDLRACSLVSRAWLPRSRYHLFYHVALRSDRSHPSRFLKLLGSPHGTIAPYARHLELYEGKETKQWEKVWLNKAFSRLAMMTNVESIRISHADFDKFDNMAITALLSIFSRLTYLRLEHCSFLSVPLFLDLLSASTRLERLALVSIKAESESSNRAGVFERVKNTVRAKKKGEHIPAFTIPQQVVPHLRVLEISEYGLMKEFLGWLQCGVQIPPVDTLRLNIESRDDISSYSELMRILGSSLTSLEIQFATRFGVFQSEAAGIFTMRYFLPRTLYSPCIYSDAFIREVDLTKNDHLRAICLPPACIRAYHEDLGAAGRFPLFLAQVSSPRMEEVFMDITVTSLFQLNVVDWQTIGRIFANFRSLRRVQLTIRSQFLAYWKPNFRETTVAWVENRLPDCRMKGILEIKFR
jgi:hypothetical protein